MLQGEGGGEGHLSAVCLHPAGRGSGGVLISPHVGAAETSRRRAAARGTRAASRAVSAARK